MVRRSKPSQQRTDGYRLYRQREGARITWWPDPRGPGHGEMYWGTVVSHIGDTVTIIWDEDDEYFEVWSSQECRYRVDRGQMRFIPPPKQRRVRIHESELTCKVCGKPRSEGCGCKRPGSMKPEERAGRSVHQLLTGQTPYDRVVISIEGNALDGKGALMAKKKVAPVVEEDELEELEELDDAVEEVAEAEGDENVLTAKAAASILGTDGRTLRKFLRKKHGTVGQGQRWEIDANDVDQLKVEFAAWAGGGKKESKPKATKPKPDAAPLADAELDELEEIDDLDMEEDD